MTNSEREVVAALAQALIQRIGEPRYSLWFGRHTRFTWEENRLVVGFPNRHLQEYLQDKFGEAVRAAAAEVLGAEASVRFVIDPELFQAARQEQTLFRQTEPPPGPADAREPSRKPPRELPTLPLLAPQSSPLEETATTSPREPVRRDGRAPKRRWRRLADFVVGASNRVAQAAALSTVEAPGQGANPLVLHGPVGTGKTHLLEGIYVGLRKAHPDWRVCFITAEDFTNRFVQAMRLGKLGAFRKHFRECDALLVDDLHFLATKRATQEEFLHTFDVLQAEGKQVVLTCDCHPRLADEFAPELADRLLGGGVWGMTPPDGETRLAILRCKAQVAGERPVPDDVLVHLAGRLRGNVRELEGALQSVRHFARVMNRPVDLALAMEALGDLLRHTVRIVQLADVERAVVHVLRLESGALQSRQRAWTVSHPRMLAMYLARKHTAAAYSDVGRHFGGRNHSTAVAAEKKVRHWLREDGELLLGERRLRVREIVELIERELLK